MNLEIFRLINNLAYKNNALDKIMIFFSQYVEFIFMAAIVIVFILGIIKKNGENRKVALNTVVFTVINLFINLIIRSIFHVDRPFVNNKVNLLLPHDSASSFPSNHATGTMSIALGLGKYNKVLSIILTILSIIVGFSRVYVGHHYPLDVLGAYLLVYITGYIYNLKIRNIVENFYERIEKKVMFRLGVKESPNEI